jgi:hypothetical protein
MAEKSGRKTWGFSSLKALDKHFLFHQEDTGCETVDEYGETAFELLNRPLDDDWQECTQKDGAKVRYHRVTQQVLFIWPDGRIASYFKKDTDEAAWVNNRVWFRNKCGQ